MAIPAANLKKVEIPAAIFLHVPILLRPRNSHASKLATTAAAHEAHGELPPLPQPLQFRALTASLSFVGSSGARVRPLGSTAAEGAAARPGNLG